MQMGDMIRLQQKNGQYDFGQLLSANRSEITYSKKNRITTIQRKHIAKVSRLGPGRIDNRLQRRTRLQRRAQLQRRTKDLAEKNKHSGEVAAPIRQRDMSAKSYLYLLDLGNNYYKVGYTKNMKNRLKALKAASTNNIEVLQTAKVSAADVTKQEALVKRKFGKKFVQSSGGTEVFYVARRSQAVRAFSS